MLHLHYALPTKRKSRTRKGFSAIDFSPPGSAMNVADITLRSRYPEKGLAVNHVSEMVVRILSGEVVFHCGSERISLSAGSVIQVPANYFYSWEPKGRVRMLVVSTPPWTPEQHHNPTVME